MRVLTILVRHGSRKYVDAERDLADMFRRQLPAVKRDTLIVDTALATKDVEVAGSRVIPGDNSSSEFSGFDSGLACVSDQLFDYDLVNLTTSAFGQLYVDYLDRFRPDVLSAASNRAVCVGHIDCYNEAIEVFGCRSQHWLRTSCVFLPPAELRIMGSLVSARNREEWFSGDPAAPFRHDAPLSHKYQQLITEWLTGQDIGQGVTWHTRIGLNEQTLPEFERKAFAILNEHLFGLRLRAAGCRTIDVTWLSGLLARGRVEIDWDLPWWRQLADRDRHAVRIDTTARIAS